MIPLMLWWNLRQVRSADVQTRRRAIKALGESRHEKAVESLIQALEDFEETVRDEAAAALGKMGGIAVKALIEALRDSASYVRKGAATALEVIADPRSVVPLVIAGGDSEYGVRLHAESALRAIAERLDRRVATTQVPSLTAQLSETLKHPNEMVRIEAARALRIFGNEDAIGPLIAALQDASGQVRQDAADALIAFKFEPADQTQQALILIAQSKWDDVVALGPEVVDSILQHLSRDTHDDRAIRALAEIGDLRAVEPLIAILKKSDKIHTRSAAAWALGELRDLRAVQPLLAAMRHEHEHLRRSAAEAIGKIGDEKALRALIPLLRDKNSDVRNTAAHALKNAESTDLRQIAAAFFSRADNGKQK